MAARNHVICVLALVLCCAPLICGAGGTVPRSCLPDSAPPAESMGPLSVPLDIPICPTLVKTEFHIFPWVSLGTASICIPGTGKSIAIPAPCFSLKPVPVWFPWFRPIDAECTDRSNCGLP
jgi:hypothetical protein